MKIKPEQVDGYLQATRDSMMQEEAGRGKPPSIPKKGNTKPVSILELATKEESHKRIAKPADPTIRVAFQPKAEAISQPKIVSEAKKEISKGEAESTTPAPRALVNGKKNDMQKGISQLVWKPKARASGRRDLDISPDLTLEMEDPPVRRVGTEKYLPPDEAEWLAVQRAAELESEVNVKTPARISRGSDSMDCIISPQKELKQEREPVHPDYSTETGDFMISTINPCEGAIPIPPASDDTIPLCLWDKDVLPLDFPLLNFSDMEEGTRRLVSTNDAWLYQDEVDPILGPTKSDLNEMQRSLDDWWEENLPLVSERIVPFIRNIMLSEPNAHVPFGESYTHALECLAEGGAMREQQLSAHALEAWIKRGKSREGHTPSVVITFGGKAKCIDYVAQAASVGSLHFTSIDMGEDLPLSLKLRQALGSEGTLEMNQCVIKHLALALDWRYNGRKFRIPTRSRVEVLAAEIRAWEFPQAQLCFEHITKPSTTLEHEIWSCIHDTMNLGRDRSFKRLGWLLKENCPNDTDFSIRIFDYEELKGQQKVIAYLYDSGIYQTPPNESLNFIVARNRLRFLLPSKETFTGSWKPWPDFVSCAKELEWLTWKEALEQDTLETSEIHKIECTVCGKKVKTV